jgi:glycosyltransferase involved in cell wall biosynthesis
MIWTVLIATLQSRAARLTNLLNLLMPQVEAAHGAVTVCALRNNGERPLSYVRQSLIDNATSQYVSFVDDDDLVATDYVGRILPLLDGVDQIGWRMQHYATGVPSKPTYHSLRYRGGWYEDDFGYYRDISHLNPILTELAREVSYRGLPPPEDVAWANAMRGRVRTEHYIEEIMYHYYASNDSTWQPGVALTTTFGGTLPTIGSPHFSYHPEST